LIFWVIIIWRHTSPTHSFSQITTHLELNCVLYSGISYCGGTCIADLQKNAEFVRITSAGKIESDAHDVNVLWKYTKQIGILYFSLFRHSPILSFSHILFASVLTEPSLSPYDCDPYTNNWWWCF
jgi:hypothetical protein